MKRFWTTFTVAMAVLTGLTVSACERVAAERDVGTWDIDAVCLDGDSTHNAQALLFLTEGETEAPCEMRYTVDGEADRTLLLDGSPCSNPTALSFRDSRSVSMELPGLARGEHELEIHVLGPDGDIRTLKRNFTMLDSIGIEYCSLVLDSFEACAPDDTTGFRPDIEGPIEEENRLVSGCCGEGLSLLGLEEKDVQYRVSVSAYAHYKGEGPDVMHKVAHLTDRFTVLKGDLYMIMLRDFQRGEVLSYEGLSRLGFDLKFYVKCK